MYDTLSYVKKLESVGVPRKQAEAQVEIMTKFVDTHFSTKQDLKDLEVRLVNKIDEQTAELRHEFKTDMAEFRGDVKSDFHQLRLEMSEQTIKMGRMFIVATTVMIAAMGLMLKF